MASIFGSLFAYGSFIPKLSGRKIILFGKRVVVS